MRSNWLEEKGLTCRGLVIAELTHELRNVENGVGGSFDALAGPVAAAEKCVSKSIEKRRAGESLSSRVKRLLRETHRTIHVGQIVPALRVLRMQANGVLQQRRGGVDVPFDGAAGAALSIRRRIGAACADSGIVTGK